MGKFSSIHTLPLPFAPSSFLPLSLKRRSYLSLTLATNPNFSVSKTYKLCRVFRFYMEIEDDSHTIEGG